MKTLHPFCIHILHWSLKRSVKWSWTGSAFSTNENARSAMVTGSQSRVWSGPYSRDCERKRAKDWVYQSGHGQYLEVKGETLSTWIKAHDNFGNALPLGWVIRYESILVYCPSLQAPIYLQLKVGMSNSITYLNQTHVSEWNVVWCGSANGCQKYMCMNEIGLRAQNIVIMLGSMVNITGETYVTI